MTSAEENQNQKTSGQPTWRFIVNLGDASPLDHGGYFLYQDETGVYGFEAEKVEPSEEDEDKIEIRRVCLDRLKEVRKDDRIYLVPFAYEENWPHPVASYVEWFDDKLKSIADFVDSSEEELRADLCSEDGIRRAEAYRAIYDHEGWGNVDEYPLVITREEAEERYAETGAV